MHMHIVHVLYKCIGIYTYMYMYMYDLVYPARPYSKLAEVISMHYLLTNQIQ